MTVPDTPALQGHELVAHVFLPVGRPADHAIALALWDRAVAEFALSEPIAAHPHELQAAPPPVADGESLLAARAGPAAGMHQIVARRVHDVLCVSLVCAPQATDGWEELDERWRRVAVATSSDVLGSVRIRQARLLDPHGRPADVDPDALAAPDGPLRWIGGPVEPEPRIGPVVIWEALDDCADQTALDGRRDRELVVLAAADRDPQLSAFTWSRGGRRLTPFGNYLLHAAKLRYVVRTRSTTVRALPRLRTLVDGAYAELNPHVRAGRIPDGAAQATRDTLTELAAADLELTTRRGLLGELRTSVEAAETNMGRYAGRDRTAEPFADDSAVATWLHEQIGHDLAHVEGPRTRLRGLVAAVTPLVPDDVAPTQHRTLVAALLALLGKPSNPQLRTLVESGLLDLDSAVSAAADGEIDVLSDIRAPAGAFVDRDGGALEHVVRELDGFQNPRVFWAGLDAAVRRVCLVDVPGLAAEGGGTGFLVAPDLVLTNYHVLTDVIAGPVPAANVSCLFDHSVGPDGGIVHGVGVGLAEDWLVTASPPSPFDAAPRPAGLPAPDELDYALVRLARPVPGEPNRGSYDLLAAPPTLRKDQTMLVLQHPDGQRIKMAFGPVLSVNGNGTRVLHHVNTVAGSSGGPCLTLDMRLAALHHAGSPRDVRDPNGAKVNAAVPIASIRRHLIDGGFANLVRNANGVARSG